MITIEFHHLVAFAVALIVAFFATPIARKIAVNSGAVNIPNDSRRIHKKPMALMGGLAIIAGFVLATVYSFATNDIKSFAEFLIKPKTLGILAGVLIIIILGIVDDIKALRARVKFPIQLIAAIIVVATGTRITTISKPFQETVALHPGMMYMLGDILAFAISIVWIVGMTNAINLIDGLDGLAAGCQHCSYYSLYCISHSKTGRYSEISVSLVGGAGFTV